MTTNAPRPGFMSRHRKALLLLGPVVLLLGAAYFYFTGDRYVSSDDAYVQASRTEISSNINGRVVSIAVKDNQPVKKGDILFTLDDSDWKIAIEDAQAKLAAAKLQIAALKATYLQHVADVQAANDALSYRHKDFDRQQKLAHEGISSQADLDKAKTALVTAEQQKAATEQQEQNALAALGGNADVNVDDHPVVAQAKAALDRALLDLSYTAIKAPADGIVTKVEQLQAGSYIKAATPVFSLVSDKEVWVEANFKETDLAHMHVGQDATVEIDALPGKIFHGKVVSFSPGTGSSFSLLPAENASGNWVKVVQRLPVRISIDDAEAQAPLQAGLSATATVDTLYTRLERERAGHGGVS